MSEFNNVEIQSVEIGEPIVLKEKTTCPVTIGVAVIFHKTGDYHVSVTEKQITVEPI